MKTWPSLVKMIPDVENNFVQIYAISGYGIETFYTIKEI